MRIATLNAQCGGYESYRDYQTKEPPRLPALQEAIADLKADTVVLSDTFRWDEFSQADLRKIFDMEWSAHFPLNDATLNAPANRRIGVTVLSKRELIGAQAIDLAGRNGIETSIETDDSRIISLFGAYLHHASEKKRLAQIEALLPRLAIKGLRRVVLAGDLNSSDRTDKSAYLKRRALKQLPQVEFIKEVSDVLEGQVIDALKNIGLRDANLDRHNTWPTLGYRLLGGFAVPIALLRPDHIFVSPDIQVENSQVMRDRKFDRASDHYPLLADLRLL